MINGRLVAACEQERYSLDKHSRQFPGDALADCLTIGGRTVADLDEIAIAHDHRLWARETYLKPALEDDRRLNFLLADAERIRQSLAIPEFCRENTGFTGPIGIFRHHLGHLASTYYPSGFDRALLLSQDGIGEFDTGMLAIGDGGRIEAACDANRYPDSLGLLYSAVTHYLGWKHHCDEGIVMGLAPYGDPEARIPGRTQRYLDAFRDILQETGDFTYRVNRDWIAYHQERDRWVSDAFLDLFGPKRAPADPILPAHRNVAAALQRRLEEVVLNQLGRARSRFGLARLCLAGGVGLNCSLNGKIAASRLFDEIFVPPASGDAGLAIGACYLAHQKRQGGALMPQRCDDYYLGSRFDETAMARALAEADLPAERPGDLHARVADCLARGAIVGWFAGGAEFGPRALGNRSILARPFPAAMKDHLNRRVKFREEFRPFAPAVLAERATDYFEIGQSSPHMLIAVPVRADKRDEIPAVVHVDASCRVQTVDRDLNPHFRQLLEAFAARTGVPVVLNTSFNVKGQPIVNSPAQAVACFLGTQIDVLALGPFLVEKDGWSATP